MNSTTTMSSNTTTSSLLSTTSHTSTTPLVTKTSTSHSTSRTTTGLTSTGSSRTQVSQSRPSSSTPLLFTTTTTTTTTRSSSSLQSVGSAQSPSDSSSQTLSLSTSSSSSTTSSTFSSSTSTGSSFASSTTSNAPTTQTQTRAQSSSELMSMYTTTITSGGGFYTVTELVPAQSGGVGQGTGTESFLHRTGAAAGVFTLVGIAGAGIIIALLFFVFRARRRAARLEEHGKDPWAPNSGMRGHALFGDPSPASGGPTEFDLADHEGPQPRQLVGSRWSLNDFDEYGDHRSYSQSQHSPPLSPLHAGQSHSFSTQFNSAPTNPTYTDTPMYGGAHPVQYNVHGADPQYPSNPTRQRSHRAAPLAPMAMPPVMEERRNDAATDNAFGGSLSQSYYDAAYAQYSGPGNPRSAPVATYDGPASVAVASGAGLASENTNSKALGGYVFHDSVGNLAQSAAGPIPYMTGNDGGVLRVRHHSRTDSSASSSIPHSWANTVTTTSSLPDNGGAATGVSRQPRQSLTSQRHLSMDSGVFRDPFMDYVANSSGHGHGGGPAQQPDSPAVLLAYARNHHHSLSPPPSERIATRPPSQTTRSSGTSESAVPAYDAFERAANPSQPEIDGFIDDDDDPQAPYPVHTVMSQIAFPNKDVINQSAVSLSDAIDYSRRVI